VDVQNTFCIPGFELFVQDAAGLALSMTTSAFANLFIETSAG